MKKVLISLLFTLASATVSAAPSDAKVETSKVTQSSEAVEIEAARQALTKVVREKPLLVIALKNRRHLTLGPKLALMDGKQLYLLDCAKECTEWLAELGLLTIAPIYTTSIRGRKPYREDRVTVPDYVLKAIPMVIKEYLKAKLEDYIISV